MKKTYGLIGYPLGHSFSEKYFSEKFEKEKINDCEFKLFPLEDIADFNELIRNSISLMGLSVTIPYKEKIIPYLDELDIIAKSIGAVNCIKKKGNQLIGFNTDVTGFRKSIKPFLQSNHDKALILGTGGASKAVAYVLKEIGIDCFFLSRNKGNEKNIFSYHQANENMINNFKLIINTTPVGMFPKTDVAPALPYSSVTSSHLLYDLIYNPNETLFLKMGKEKGAICVNGISMLHLQAEEAWRIWNK